MPDKFDTVEENGIRRFSDTSLNDAIQAAILRRNPTKDLVVVGHIDQDTMYLYRIGGDFSVVAAAYKSKKAPTGWGYGAEVVWEPF